MRFSYLDYYIPETQLPVQDVLGAIDSPASLGDFSDVAEYEFFIKKVLKIKSLRCEMAGNELEMVSRLLDRLFAAEPQMARQINAIVLAQAQGPTEGLLKQVQHKYGIQRAYSFTVSGNECANTEVAVNLGVALLRSNPTINHVAIIAAAKSPNVRERILGSYAVLGDAAGVIVLSRGNTGLRVVDQSIISTGAFLNPGASANQSVIHTKYYLALFSDLFSRHEGAAERLAHIIVQNANPLLITQCLSASKLPINRLFTANFGRYGHLHCLDFVVNLTDLVRGKTLKPDDLVLTVGLGWNGSYVASLLAA